MGLSAGEIPNQPRINGTEGKAASSRLGPCALCLVEQPLDFCCAEICVQFQSGFAANEPVSFVFPQRIANVRCAAILPNDGIGDGLAGSAIPNERRLALVCDADGSDVAGGLVAGVALGAAARRLADSWR